MKKCVEETSVCSQKNILFQKNVPDGKASQLAGVDKGGEKKKTEAKEGWC